MIQFLLFATLMVGQVSMDVVAGDRKVGTARLTQKLQPDGTKQVQVSLSLTGPQGSVTVREEATYQPSGAPLRQVVEMSDKDGKRLATIVATFDDDGAHVVTDAAGKRTSVKIPLGKALPRANVSEYWFVRDTPKVGAKVTYYRLNIRKQEWEQVTVRYLGKKPVKVGNQTIEAHCLEQGDQTAYLDDSGMPYLLKTPEMTLVRH
jgi:hypothetical protein